MCFQFDYIHSAFLFSLSFLSPPRLLCVLSTSLCPPSFLMSPQLSLCRFSFITSPKPPNVSQMSLQLPYLFSAHRLYISAFINPLSFLMFSQLPYIHSASFPQLLNVFLASLCLFIFITSTQVPHISSASLCPFSFITSIQILQVSSAFQLFSAFIMSHQLLNVPLESLCPFSFLM